MIKTKHSGAKFSAIVGIGENLKKKSIEENQEYLLLHRGINAVVNIDIQDLVSYIDFNSDAIQIYPYSIGKHNLRAAINKTYFHNSTNADNIYITNGGTSALDLIFKTIDIQEVIVPELYWGAYINVLKITGNKYSFYSDLEDLRNNIKHYENKAVLICDPSNPTGAKLDDNELLNTVELLNKAGVVVVIDSPYRRMFFDWKKDTFYKQLVKFENVIVSESFSKSIGLSGQRVGFIHSTKEEFLQELRVNLLFSTNGINSFAQVLIEKILTDEKGIKAANDFRQKTVSEIEKNVKYLIDNKLLAERFYGNTVPVGIFTLINKNPDELLKYRIGSVPLNYFTQLPEGNENKYARICVSVPHDKFALYFDRLLQNK